MAQETFTLRFAGHPTWLDLAAQRRDRTGIVDLGRFPAKLGTSKTLEAIASGAKHALPKFSAVKTNSKTILLDGPGKRQ